MVFFCLGFFFSEYVFRKTLIVVEESVEWDKVNRVLIETVLALDPTFARTIFVHTKFNTMLQGLDFPFYVVFFLSVCL